MVATAESEKITTGVNPILMAASSTLAVVDPTKAKGIVYLKPGDNAKSWPNAVEGRDKGMYFGGEDEGPFVAIAKRNAGKAAFIGDSSPIEDTTARYRKEQGGGVKNLHNGWNDPGNAATLSINIINWLATPENYGRFDGSNGHASGKTTASPLAPAEHDDPDDGEPWKQLPPGYDPWNTDTYAPGSYGAPLPLTTTGGAGGGGTNGGSGGNGPVQGELTVQQAFDSPNGTTITVIGVIQGELNDEFGLKLGETVESTTFLSVQIPKGLRPEFSPKLKPAVRGQKIRIVGTRGRYTGLPGIQDVQKIEKVGQQ